MSRVTVALACALAAWPWIATADDAGSGAPDAGTAEEAERRGEGEAPAPIEPTSDIDALTIRHLSAVLARKGDRMEVSELITFASRAKTRFFAPAGLRVELPRGAVAPRTSDADGERLAAEVDARGFAVAGPIGPAGVDLSISFEVPIEDGVAAFEQRLPAAVSSFRVVSAWTRGGARLEVAGAGEAVLDELGDGLVAAVAAGRGLGHRALSVRVTGVEDGAVAWIRRAALAICAALFAAGAWAYARRRRDRGGAA